jgi:drug/metabolite transporter (DMT)-like permease
MLRQVLLDGVRESQHASAAMRAPLIPLLLTVTGAVIYQISSKSVPRAAHPLVAIIAAYFTAIALCLLATWKWPMTGSLSGTVRQLNWAVAGVGVGAALIEVGFLLVYRSGWPLSIASVIVNVTAAIILVPVGLSLFQERLSLPKVLGAAFCLFGLMLISRD